MNSTARSPVVSNASAPWTLASIAEAFTLRLAERSFTCDSAGSRARATAALGDGLDVFEGLPDVAPQVLLRELPQRRRGRTRPPTNTNSTGVDAPTASRG